MGTAVYSVRVNGKIFPLCNTIHTSVQIVCISLSEKADEDDSYQRATGFSQLKPYANVSVSALCNTY